MKKLESSIVSSGPSLRGSPISAAHPGLDSATESESEDVVHIPDHGVPTIGLEPIAKTPPPAGTKGNNRTSQAPKSDSDSSPPRPTKKVKASSSDDDSEEERARRIAQIKTGAGGGIKRGGTRQPIKRGGKRF